MRGDECIPLLGEFRPRSRAFSLPQGFLTTGLQPAPYRRVDLMDRHTTPPSPATLTHLRASNHVGTIYVGVAIGATVVGGWLSLQPAIGAWALGQVVLAACFVEWFVILHECGHGTMFRDRRANSLA